jgi:hypothetical protein
MEETLITSVSFAWRAFTLYRGRTSTGFSVVPISSIRRRGESIIAMAPDRN